MENLKPSTQFGESWKAVEDRVRSETVENHRKSWNRSPLEIMESMATNHGSVRCEIVEKYGNHGKYGIMEITEIMSQNHGRPDAL